MNKKAAVFHWILFGVLGSLVLFYILAAKIDAGSGVKGEWQLQFLKENYLEAEKDLLKLDIAAQKIGRETAIELAKNGGYPPGKISDCEVVGTAPAVPLWNAGTRWCFPDIAKNVQEVAAAKFASERFSVPTEIQSKGLIFTGKGEKKSISSPAGTYRYDTNFAVNIDYSFADYLNVEQEATDLVLKCHAEADLAKCLQQKPNWWKYGPCGQQSTAPPTTRRMVFCVEGTVLSGGPLLYQLGLDFSSSEVFPVDRIEVVANGAGFELQFPEREKAERYRIYLTDDLILEGKTGTVEDLAREVKTGFNYQWKILDEFAVLNIVADAATCPPNAGRAPSKAYRCGDKIIYVPDLTRWPQTVLLAVTVIEDGKESAIQTWVKREILVS